MTTRENLRARILELIPGDRFVAASDVVATLSHFPPKAVWAQIVALALDGEIAAEDPGRYNGRAMVRRALARAVGGQ
jgi:hypothetical protein